MTKKTAAFVDLSSSLLQTPFLGSHKKGELYPVMTPSPCLLIS